MEYTPFDIRPLHYRDNLCMTLGGANWEQFAQFLIIRSQLKGKWEPLALDDFPGYFSHDSKEYTLSEMIGTGYVSKDDSGRYSLTQEAARIIIEGGFASEYYQKRVPD